MIFFSISLQKVFSVLQLYEIIRYSQILGWYKTRRKFHGGSLIYPYCYDCVQCKPCQVLQALVTMKRKAIIKIIIICVTVGWRGVSHAWGPVMLGIRQTLFCYKRKHKKVAEEIKTLSSWPSVTQSLTLQNWDRILLSCVPAQCSAHQTLFSFLNNLMS